MRIGLDLDNTIIRYDALLRRLAVEMGVPEAIAPLDRLALRQAVRDLPNGDVCWCVTQSRMYGPEIGEAEVFFGVRDFLTGCAERNVECFVVSHKTRFAVMDKDQSVDLRLAALDFMKQKGLFDTLLRDENVYFESTRRAKVERIAGLNLDVFVDDLPEVFAEPGFPKSTRALLFQPHGSGVPGITRCQNWDDVAECVLKERP